MSLIFERGFNLKIGYSDDAVEWIRKNEKELADSGPAGVEHLGFYAVTFGGSNSSSDWRMLARLDSYAALDRIADELRNQRSRYCQLIEEFMTFVDPRNADMDRVVLKRVQDVVFAGDAAARGS